MIIRKVDKSLWLQRWVAEKQFPVYIRRWGLNSLREHKKAPTKALFTIIGILQSFPNVTRRLSSLWAKSTSPSMAGKLWSYNINTNIDSILRRLFLFRQPAMSHYHWYADCAEMAMQSSRHYSTTRCKIKKSMQNKPLHNDICSQAKTAQRSTTMQCNYKSQNEQKVHSSHLFKMEASKIRCHEVSFDQRWPLYWPVY